MDNEALIEQARNVPIEDVIARHGIKLRRSGQERIGPCPKCGGTDRFSINNAKGVFNCRGCQHGGDVIALVEFLDDVDFPKAIETLTGNGLNGGRPQPKPQPQPGPGGRIVATYDYENEAGTMTFQVVKYEPKDFRQRRPKVGGGWIPNLHGVRLVPYRLPELIEAIGFERTIFIVEGEKDVDNVIKLGAPATCNPRGAGKWGNCNIDDYFRGANVVIIADHDPQTRNKKTGELLTHQDGRPRFAGWDHAYEVAQHLEPIAESVRLIDLKHVWPQCPEKGDISDWINAGGTMQALYDIAEETPLFDPTQVLPPSLQRPDDAVLPVTFPFPIDGNAIPRRPWIVPGLLLRRHLTVLVAPPGSGKSLLSLQLGMVCSVGSNWSGWRSRGRARVLIINAEEDDDELSRRLYAAQEFMKMDSGLLDGFAFADHPESIVIAKTDNKNRTVAPTPMLERIVATIIANAFDIIIVDPFAETFVGDENSNSELKWAAALWREVARRTNAAVLLVHHTKKYAQDMAGDPDAGRGGGSLVGVARIVCTLFTMTEKEAEKLLPKDEPPENRFKYIRFDDAKANLNLMTFKARWFEKETVKLPNGNESEPPDEVGVLKPWKPPDVLYGLSTKEVIEILKQLKRGVVAADGRETGDPFSKFKGGERWAGNVIQAIQPRCTEAQVKDIIKIWIKNGFLQEYEDTTSTSKGASRQCLRVVGMPSEIEEAR
jgi:hypothetical protein